MGWWVYNAGKKYWQLGPNLQYGIRDEWTVNGEKVRPQIDQEKRIH